MSLRQIAVVLLAALTFGPAVVQANHPGASSYTYEDRLLEGGLVYQPTHNYAILLKPGDTITATLTWDAHPINDLDLLLFPPSMRGVTVDFLNPLGAVEGLVATRVARATCTDAVASSTSRFSSAETFTLTVPEGGESGSYELQVRGWLTVEGQIYTLVIDLEQAHISPPSYPVSINFVQAAPYCQA